MSRLVIIDDTNPSVQYSGPWFEVNNLVDLGSFGPPFQNTLHGVNVTASFTFSFMGSGVIVYGTSITTNVSGIQDPTWECFIDNNSIGWDNSSKTAGQGNANNWPLCSAGPFQDGPHLLTVNANVSNQQTFWFDQIQYTPSASVSLDQQLLRIDSNDSAIRYEGPWSPGPGPENTTSVQESGSSLTYKFSGTSISMYGSAIQVIDVGSNIFGNASYFVDDQLANFDVPFAIVDNDFNLMLFDTGQLSPGEHEIKVEYLSNPPQPALYFSYFVQQGLPSSTTPSNTPTSTSVPSGTTTIHKKPTDAIIGGVIGGFVLISLLLALFFFNRRRNNRGLSEMSYTIVASPFTVPSSNPNSIFLPEDYTSNGQSLPSPFISSKFTKRHQRNQPSDPSSTSSGGGIPPLTPLRPQFPSPVPSSSPIPPAASQANFDGTRTIVPQAGTEPLIQRSLSLRGANARFLQYEDSGVRISSSDDDVQVLELPPFYTPG